MFGCENTLTVGYALPETAPTAQVNPINFGIDYFSATAAAAAAAADPIGTYSSTICFSPHQSFAGVGFEWRQYLGWWNGDDCQSDWWFDISFPF